MKFRVINNWRFDGFWQDITFLRINWEFDKDFKSITIEILNFIFTVWVD